VPADHVLKRIYICWCFFNGDAAQFTGSLEASDGWFGDAAVACADDDDAGMRAFANYQRADVWIPADTDRSLRLITEPRLEDAARELEDLSLRAYIARMYGDIRWASGEIRGAFDAYGRALLLSYVYQVDQESEYMPPNAYSSSLYAEMRTRFLSRLTEAKAAGHATEADAAIARIGNLFAPYRALNRTSAAADEGPLAGVVPPLPDKAVLDEFESEYANDARDMREKLEEQIDEPVDQLLPGPEALVVRDRVPEAG
jgi:hypothetical protein